MKQEQLELYNTAKHNKNHLKGQSLIVNINNYSYPLQISGIGTKAVKLSLFLTYEDIIKYRNHRRLETLINRKINTVYHSKKKGTVWRAE